MSIIPRDGSTIDLQPLFYKLTFDSATEFLLGESVNSLLGAPGSAQEKLEEAFDYAKSHFPNLPLQHRFHRPKYQAAVDVVHNFVDRHVETFLEKEKLGLGERYDQGIYVFLPEVVKVMPDPMRLRNEILNLLLAGRDTTAGLLSNTFYVLARRLIFGRS
jgi:cytochrome P450